MSEDALQDDERGVPVWMGNLFEALPGAAASSEVFDTLLAAPGLRIERIVSTGQASPPGFWYDQDEAEWVLVLQGQALLRFEDEAAPRALGRGDFVFIAAHRRHRVEWTSPDMPTVWLAIHHRVQPG